METTNTTGQQPLWERYAYAIKAVVIGILVLVLLIPTAMIMGLINERKQLQQQATKEVSAKWANAQTITGPVLVVPYTEINVVKTETGVRQEEVFRHACFLPEQLTINGQLQPEIRKRGIYEVAVYGSQFRLSGSFSPPDLVALNISPDRLRWNEAYLAIGISDMRGIGNQVQVLWNGQPYLCNPGTPPGGLLKSGLQARVPLAAESAGAAGASFTIHLQLKGSGEVNFSPVGKTTRVNLQAGWSNPSFDGAFLPDSRKVEDKRFSAAWQVLHLNRSFPQSWTTGDKYDIHDADFGVKLFLPVDVYLKSMRAVKYAILIIGLSFLLFYFIELLRHHSIHPLQYILIGVALCIFYTLLISLAEQLGFNMAYCIATVLTLGLVTTYTASVLPRTGTALAVGATLLTLYGFIYVIIQSEDQALLMGSLGLFIILAIVMYFSRKIRWEALDR